MDTLLYAGSFDPVTRGHMDVIRRAAALCPELVVAVMHNPEKHGFLPVPMRVELLKTACRGLNNVRVIAHGGLLIDCAHEVGAKAVIRGLRPLGDFESEYQMAQVNKRLGGVETLLMTTSDDCASISSSIVRQVAAFGGDISPLVPEGTAQKKAAEAQLSEEEAAAQDAEMSGGAETVAEAADDPVETAAVRLGQKLGLGATQEDDGSERETAFSADLAGTAAANAALLRAREAESADNASDWIRKLLSADGRDGASAAAARGKNDFSLAQEQEVRETESFSLSLERDARRYDGGFLFY